MKSKNYFLVFSLSILCCFSVYPTSKKIQKKHDIINDQTTPQPNLKYDSIKVDAISDKVKIITKIKQQ